MRSEGETNRVVYRARIRRTDSRVSWFRNVQNNPQLFTCSFRQNSNDSVTKLAQKSKFARAQNELVFSLTEMGVPEKWGSFHRRLYDARDFRRVPLARRAEVAARVVDWKKKTESTCDPTSARARVRAVDETRS